MARSWLTLPVLAAAVWLGGCSNAGLDCGGEASGCDDDGGGGSGSGSGTSVSAGATGGGTREFDEPASEVACNGEPESFEGVSLRATSTASATYALAALRSGRLPEPAALRPDELWNAFGPSAAREAGGVVVRGLPRSLGADLRVTFDARYLPSVEELGPRPPLHLVVAADVGESMARELQLEADVLRALGGALDVEGDRLSVILWGAPEVVVFEVADPGARAEAAATTIEALIGEQLVPSAGFERVVPWIEGMLDDPTGAHVLLLTDGASPIGSAEVAQLALRAPVSVAQLAMIDAAPAAGESASPVPFAGSVLRSVAAAGDGAALWIGSGEQGAELLSFELSFDATFRRVPTSQRLLVTPPAWLRAEPPSGEGGGGSVVFPSLGYGEPVRVEVPVVLCGDADLAEPISGTLTSPLGTPTSFVGPPARPGPVFSLVDPLVAHTLAVEEAAAIIVKPCHDPALRASFNQHVEALGQRDAGRVDHLKEMVQGHADLVPLCEVGP